MSNCSGSFYYYVYDYHRHLHSFPTRRSSDLEISIGRAPNSDILLSKDKLTSRRHATVSFENGKYILHDERSANGTFRSEEHTSELQSRFDLVCRLLLEKKYFCGIENAFLYLI